MGKMGGFMASDLKKLQKQLNKIQENSVETFAEACAKELAARLLAKVIKCTPVGQYPASSGKNGGTLRRGWTVKTYEEAKSGKKASAKAYADSLEIKHIGNIIQVEIINPVEYASYVEFGHWTSNHKGWVKGKFMLTISAKEIETIAPAVLEAKIKKILGDCFG